MNDLDTREIEQLGRSFSIHLEEGDKIKVLVNDKIVTEFDAPQESKLAFYLNKMRKMMQSRFS